MNRLYDQQEAILVLNSYIAQSRQGHEKEGTESLSQLKVEDVMVESFQDPEAFRLTRAVDGEPEEVTVRIPGILCQKNLPPFLAEIPREIKHVRKLRQFVKLSGLGSSVFDEQQAKVDEIYEAFSKKLAPKPVQPLTFRTHEGWYAIDVHARYFTDRKDAPTMRHVPFQAGVDPLHRLDDARRDVFIHGEENVVQYGRRVVEAQGTRRERVDPGIFEVGDIVEASVSFVCYPVFGGGYVIRPTLRSLTLETSDIREKAKAQRDQEKLANTGQGKKRAYGEGCEEREGAGRRVKRRFIQFDE